MYCSQCGKELSGNVRYCPECGIRQRMGIITVGEIFSGIHAGRREEQKSKSASGWGRRCRDFLVMAIALLILFAMNEKVPDAGNYTSWQMNASYSVIQNQKEMIVCNGQGGACTLDVPQQILYSADHCQMAYVDRDQELYHMDDMTSVFVDDDVVEAELSFYGDTLVYLKHTEESGQELCIYVIKDGASEQIFAGNCMEFSLSPDGKTIAYLEAGNDGILSVWHTDGQAARLTGDVSEILSVSEGGKEVLYRKDKDGLFLFAGGEERKIASASGTIRYLLNESQTEILYMENGNAWYYSMDRTKPVRLTGVKGVLEDSVPVEDIAYQRRRGLIIGRKTLKDMTFATSDSRDDSYRIYHLEEDGEEAVPVPN